MQNSTLSQSAENASRIRVYLVEDSAQVRTQIEEGLSTICGVSVEAFAETENDALHSLMLTDYDVIIFDIQLLQGNSVNLLKSLTLAHKQTHAVKIVFSNRTGETWRRICKSYGARYFFDKSFEFPQLHAAVQRVVNEAAGR